MVSTNTHITPSKLAKLPLAFEYDRTLREIKHAVKIRSRQP
jgi:hypothetical protein